MYVLSSGNPVLPPRSEAVITERETIAPPRMTSLICGSDRLRQKRCHRVAQEREARV